MLIASRLHFTPPLRPFRFTCLSTLYHGLHFSLYPLPQSPRHVFPWTTAPRSSGGYHVDGAAYWPMDNNIAHRVSRPKKISPDTDTTQYMQISPNTR